METEKEYTLALLKPDAWRRGMIGRLVNRIENMNLDAPMEIRYIQSVRLSLAMAQYFYGRQHKGKPYFDTLTTFMSSGPIVGLVLLGPAAINRWRYEMGNADPIMRRPGCIREDLGRRGDEIWENLVHGSDSTESFDHEVQALGWHPGLWQ